MLFLGTASSLLASEDSLAVLVKSKRCDDYVGWVDWEVGLLTVSLFLHDFLNVDAPLSAVDFSYFAFTVLVGATHDFDGVTVAHGDAADFVFLS